MVDGRAHVAPASYTCGYTSAVGAIGQAMGITVRAPRHAHACVDVTEPAATAAASSQTRATKVQQQQQRQQQQQHW